MSHDWGVRHIFQDLGKRDPFATLSKESAKHGILKVAFAVQNFLPKNRA